MLAPKSLHRVSPKHGISPDPICHAPMSDNVSESAGIHRCRHDDPDPLISDMIWRTARRARRNPNVQFWHDYLQRNRNNLRFL